MGRMFTWETLVLAVVGTGVILGITIGYHLGTYLVFIVIPWLMLCLPLAFILTRQLVPFYLSIGRYQRALELALVIRDGAPKKKLRDQASVEVAIVQIAMGRFADALRNLEGVNAFQMGKLSHALVVANRAYCRAHLGTDLDKALEEAREARELVPGEGLLRYFEGLVLHAQGDDAKAKVEIEASLEADPDPKLPVPGERAFVLAKVLRALGDADGAKKQLAAAAKSGKKGPFASAIAEAAGAA